MPWKPQIPAKSIEKKRTYGKIELETKKKATHTHTHTREKDTEKDTRRHHWDRRRPRYRVVLPSFWGVVRQGRLAAGPVVHLFLAVFLFFFFSFFFCNSLGVPFFLLPKLLWVIASRLICIHLTIRPRFSFFFCKRYGILLHICIHANNPARPGVSSLILV